MSRRVAVFLLWVLAGCAREHPAPTPALPVAEAMYAAQDTLWVDTERTVLRWKGTKFWGLGKHEGILALASGHLFLDQQTLVGGTFVLDMRSIEVTDIPKTEPVPRNRLRTHLMSDDFFAVATYPTARFVLTEVIPQQANRYTLTDHLTLRGHTHPVTFGATMPTVSPNHMEALATFTLNRHHWGVSYQGSRLKDDVVDDQIHLDLHLFATNQPL